MGAEVALLRVIRPASVEGGRYPLTLEQRTKSASKYLGRLKDARALQGIGATVAVTARMDAGDAIAEWAAAHQADLVALMSHGFGRRARAVFGSVAERLLEASPVPVLIVRVTPQVLAEQEELEEDELDEALLQQMAAYG